MLNTSSGYVCQPSFSHACPYLAEHAPVDVIPFIRDRTILFSPDSSIYSDPVENGNPLHCFLANGVIVVTNWRLHCSQEGKPFEHCSTDGFTTFRGRIVDIFVVGTDNGCSLHTPPVLPGRYNRNVLNKFPYDSSNVAFDELKKSYVSRTTLFLKPSGKVVVLDANDPNSSLFLLVLVFRFWDAIGEDTKFCFLLSKAAFVDSDSPATLTQSSIPKFIPRLSNSDARQLVAVRKVLSMPSSSGMSPGSKTSPTPILGKLDKGELYFLYRFLLYWDKFQVSSGGVDNNMDALYLLPTNLNYDARNSSDTARLLTVTPAIVHTDEPLQILAKDIEEGTLNGFETVGFDGESIRVFLQLLGTIGDSRAAEEAIDVRGSTGTDYCHLCNVRRPKKQRARTRFMDPIGRSSLTSSTRTLLKHRAIRKNRAHGHDLKWMGISYDDKHLKYPLLSMATNILKNRSDIHKTSQGLPVISPIYDPYQCSLLGPDHILANHLNHMLQVFCECLTMEELRDWEMRTVALGKELGILTQTGFCRKPVQIRRTKLLLPYRSRNCSHSLPFLELDLYPD